MPDWVIHYVPGTFNVDRYASLSEAVLRNGYHHTYANAADLSALLTPMQMVVAYNDLRTKLPRVKLSRSTAMLRSDANNRGALAERLWRLLQDVSRPPKKEIDNFFALIIFDLAKCRDIADNGERSSAFKADANVMAKMPSLRRYCRLIADAGETTYSHVELRTLIFDAVVAGKINDKTDSTNMALGLFTEFNNLKRVMVRLGILRET